jgi:methylmalonyl-CoA/ethylmalonyl-CoA epimerase
MSASRDVPAPDTIVGMSLVPPEYIVKIDHVGIAVPDLDTAVNFYQTAFGMAKVHEEVNVEQGVREAMMAVGPGDYFQLLAPLDETSTIAKFIDRSGPGLQQVAIRVKDVRVVADHLRGAGVRMLYDEPKVGTAGSLVNFAHPKDCGGVLIELVQPNSNSDNHGEG